MPFAHNHTARAAGALLIALGWMAPVAQANPPAVAFAAPVVELLPVGELLGDGQSPLDLHMLLLRPDGSPMTGMVAELKATDGEAGAVTELRPGLYRVRYTPPAVQAEQPVELRLKGKLPDKTKLDHIWALRVTPPLDQQAQLSVDPQSLVLGRDPQANISLTLRGGAQASREGADLAFSSNSGEIKNITPMGDGRYLALYLPPAKGQPHTALIGAVDRRNPGRTYGHLAVPITAKLSIDTKSGPGCKVLIRAGDREFGPVTADAKGKAKVEVTVSPGQTAVTQRALDCPKAGELQLPLPAAPSPRVQLLPVVSGLPGDPRVGVPVRAVVVTPTGAPDPTASLQLSASAGTLSPAVHEGAGVYVSTFTPAAVASPTPARLEARVVGEESRVASVQTQLMPVRASSLSLQSDPQQLRSDTATFTLTATVRGPDGAGLTGRSLDLKLAGAKLSAPIRDNGDGTYTATLTPTGRGPVEVVGSVRAPAASNPVRDLVLLPTRGRLPNDGVSSSMLTIVALDSFGYPVANATVALRLVQGDGQLPATVRTDAAGMAQVTYTAGRGVAVVQIEAEAAGRRRGISLLQAPPELAPELQLYGPELAPTAEQRAMLEAWAPVVTRLWITRE